MAKEKNVKVVLSHGPDLDYDEADVMVSDSGVLTIKTDKVVYYAPSAWSTVSHDPGLPKKKRSSPVVKVR